ncbi:MAG: hypothetical protein HYV16_01930 [Gammaproteobacteria bacterium]|nr:hypothetical protein [Gammaproteobacteria bacterium]
MKKLQHLTAAAAVASLLSLSGVASASHTWNNYHWARTSSPFTLQVVDSVTSNWQANMTESLTKWAQSGIINFNIAAVAEGSTTRKRCPMVSGEMRVCNASYGQNGWLGLASINLDSNGHISQGTAKMNDSYSAYWTPEEKNHVMCQEIGHVFGLGHTSEDGSSQNTCMDYSTSSTSQWPNNHDYQQLQTQYAHLDSYNSYLVAAAFGPSSDACADGAKSCDGKGQKLGTKVHKAKGYETWVHVEKDGSLTVHHVYLVPGSEH